MGLNPIKLHYSTWDGWLTWFGWLFGTSVTAVTLKRTATKK
jgi:hypothetical protein